MPPNCLSIDNTTPPHVQVGEAPLIRSKAMSYENVGTGWPRRSAALQTLRGEKTQNYSCHRVAEENLDFLPYFPHSYEDVPDRGTY